MAAFAATNQPTNLWRAFGELRAHGGVELGDLVLASGGASMEPTDDAVLKPYPTVGGYLLAGRAYARDPKPERIVPPNATRFVGSLWTLRPAAPAFPAHP